MAWESGTATDFNDLMEKLDTFLTSNAALVAAGENWTRIHNTTRAATATEPSRKFKAWTAPGSTALNDIYIGGYSFGTIATDIYNMAFTGGTFFNAGAAEDPATGNPIRSGMQGRCPFVTHFADINPVPYWIVANNRRFVLVTKIGGVYSVTYCGFILPLARPDEYPYPLCISGNFRDPNDLYVRYSDQSTSHGSLSDPRSQSCWLMYPDQGWRDFYGSVAPVNPLVADNANRGISPVCVGRYNTNGQTILNTWLPAEDEYVLEPLEFCADETAGRNIWGRYDGVFYLTGAGLTSEDIVVIEGVSYLAVQSGFRNGVREYFAVELL